MTSNVTRDRRDAAVRARGGHVEHALDAVDRLLERRRDRRLDFLRVGAGVDRGDVMTCGGASVGYCATGIVGIATAPARMRTSEQTDARIGRRMKVSTNIAGLLGLHRRAVADLLDAGDDQLVARLEAARDDVVVAEQLADLDRAAAARRGRPVALLGHEAEVLAADARRPP